MYDPITPSADVLDLWKFLYSGPFSSDVPPIYLTSV